MSPEAHKTLEAFPGMIRGECGSSLTQYDAKTPVVKIPLGTVDDIRVAYMRVTVPVRFSIRFEYRVVWNENGTERWEIWAKEY